MLRLLIIALLVVGGWKSWETYQTQRHEAQLEHMVHEFIAQPASQTRQRVQPRYRCDGRTHCSQMTSCEEATFFLRNCPGTKMDGNNDGIPCERQWC